MQQKNEGMGWKQNMNAAFTICLILQRMVTIPSRTGQGIDALGTPCALACGVMLFWAGLSQDPFMWGWFVLWLLFFLRRKKQLRQFTEAGVRIHSQSDGIPVWLMRLKKCSEAEAKGVGEPFIFGLLGVSLWGIYDNLGWPVFGLPYLLIGGAIGTAFVEQVRKTIWERRAQALMDAKLDQQTLMDSFRDRYGEY